MYQAIALGFCAPIAGLPDADIVKSARYKEDKAVGVGLVATGLMYNTKYFSEKKWPAPTSWNDLKDAKYKKLLVIPPLNNTYGLHTLVMMARLNGGGEANIDPGFTVMKNDVAANVLVFEPSPGKMTELFESGQAVIAVWGSGRVGSFAATGFPVDFVYPKEGALALLASVCPVAKPNASPLAQEFVKMLLEPQFQEIFAKEYGYGPVNRRAQVAPSAARMAPIGQRAEELIVVDWDTINQKRTEWDKRWNREVER
jgi:putative spermidine/putrescine transport system substrate-binding protein